MAFALSTTQSVLWDQIKYSGSPTEFAWVLPVQPGTRVELSTDAWLAALDANTATVIQPPPLPACPPSGGGYAGGPYGGGSGTSGNYGGPSDNGAGATYVCGAGGMASPGKSGAGCGCGPAPGNSNTDPCAGYGGSAGDDGSTDFSGSSSGVGGTSSTGGSASGSSSGVPPPPPVVVETQETVGPYDIVVLHSSAGEALDTWLPANGFEVPSNIQPILDSYVAQNFDFVAMKLRPGANVNAMRPVRVIEPGADPSLPLRMIAIGAGAHVGLTLWVIGEGRYQPQNFPMTTVDFSQLTYDVRLDQTNYAQLRAAALSQVIATDAGTASDSGVGVAQDGAVAAASDARADASSDDAGSALAGGDAAPADAATAEAGDDGASTPATNQSVTGPWLVESAGPLQLTDSLTPGLLTAYQRTCVPMTPPNPCDASSGEASVDAGEVEAAFSIDASDDVFEEDGASAVPAVPDGATTSADASPPSTASACTPPAPVVCDDLQVAMTGLQVGSIWITRLVADLPIGALNQDLVLEAANQTSVSNLHRAVTWVDGNPCTSTTFSSFIRHNAPPVQVAPSSDVRGCTLAARQRDDAEGLCATGLAFAATLVRWRRRRR
jgi:hypothetical protein